VVRNLNNTLKTFYSSAIPFTQGYNGYFKEKTYIPGAFEKFVAGGSAPLLCRGRR
jgi:hypothetical protein